VDIRGGHCPLGGHRHLFAAKTKGTGAGWTNIIAYENTSNANPRHYDGDFCLGEAHPAFANEGGLTRIKQNHIIIPIGVYVLTF